MVQLPMLRALVDDWLAGRKTGARTYRWEFEEIGQGHYFTHKDGWRALGYCLLDADEHSVRRPDLTVLIEQFRPTRVKVARIKGGEEVKDEQKRVVFVQAG